jgi:hypothetical protein
MPAVNFELLYDATVNELMRCCLMRPSFDDRNTVGTRYVLIAMRTLSMRTKAVLQVHALQDAIKIDQRSDGP